MGSTTRHSCKRNDSGGRVHLCHRLRCDSRNNNRCSLAAGDLRLNDRRRGCSLGRKVVKKLSQSLNTCVEPGFCRSGLLGFGCRYCNGVLTGLRRGWDSRGNLGRFDGTACRLGHGILESKRHGSRRRGLASSARAADSLPVAARPQGKPSLAQVSKHPDKLIPACVTSPYVDVCA